MRVTVYAKSAFFGHAVGALVERGVGSLAGVVDSARAAVQSCRAKGAHVILIIGADLTDPDRDFLEGARSLGHFGIVVVSDDSERIADALVGSDQAQEGLDQALIEGSRHIAHLSHSRGKGRRVGTGGLTEREYEIARLVAKGYSNARIAEETKIQSRSVKNCVSRIMGKVGVQNRTQLAIQLHGSNASVEV